MSIRPELYRIVIVGGGAGGLILATRLGRLSKRSHFHHLQVTLIDQNPTHIWKPLLHEIAAGTLNSFEDEIAYFSHGQRNGYEFVLGQVRAIDEHANSVTLDEQKSARGEILRESISIPFDSLVIAAGSIANDFGTSGVKQYCYMLDSRTEAEHLHVHLMTQMLALKYDDQVSQATPLVISIVGGGATGVELATELATTIEYIQGLSRFENTAQHIKIRIIEAGSSLLAGQDQQSIDAAIQAVKACHIDALTSSRVKSVSATAITLESGESLASDIHIWATGIKAPVFIQTLQHCEKNRIGQIVVDQYLRAPNTSNIFVLGDCAELSQDGKRLGPRAQVAQAQAIYLAKAFKKYLQGKAAPAFYFSERGSLISLGEKIATGTLNMKEDKGHHIRGRLAKFAYDMLYKKHQIEVLGLGLGVIAMIKTKLGKTGGKFKLH